MGEEWQERKGACEGHSQSSPTPYIRFPKPLHHPATPNTLTPLRQFPQWRTRMGQRFEFSHTAPVLSHRRCSDPRKSRSLLVLNA